MKKIYLLLGIFLMSLVSADIYDDTVLISYYTFESDVNDDYGSYDLTVNGGTEAYNAGMNNNAVDLDVAEWLSASIDYWATVHSWSAWIYTADPTGDPWVNIGDGTSNTDRWHTFGNGADKLQGVVAGTADTAGYEDTGSAVPTNTWFHVACTQYSSKTTCWINGAEISNPDNTGSELDADFDTLLLGNNSGGGQSFDGMFDEVAIFEGILNTTGVGLIYNSGSGYFPSFTPPAVTLVVNLSNPLNGDHLKDSIVNLTYNVTGNEDANCSLYLNGGLNQTTTGINISSSYDGFFELPTPADGVYNWNVTCHDSLDQTGSDTRTFTYDSISPDITWNFPEFDNSSIIPYVDTSFDINITMNDTYLYQYNISIFYINGTLLYNDYELNSTAELILYNITLDNATYPVNAGDELIMNVTVSDDHTAKEIADYEIAQTPQYIEYDTGTNIIRLEAVEGSFNNLGTTKQTDRYTFFFDFGPGKKEHQINLVCDDEINYRGDLYPYPVFTCGYNWIDFDISNLDSSEIEDIIIKKLPAGQYNINIKTYSNVDKIEFQSIGGTNVVTESVYFKVSEPSQPPNITGYSPDLIVLTDDNSSVSFYINATDPENDTVSYKYYLNGVLQNSSQNFTWEVPYNLHGSNVMIGYAFDPFGNNDSVQWNVTVIDIPVLPVADNISYTPVTTWYENTANSYITCDGYDPDNETSPNNWTVDIDYRTGLIWSSLSSEYVSGNDWRAFINLTGLSGETLDARCRINDGNGYSDYIYNYNFIIVQAEYVAVGNVSGLSPSGGTRDYVTPVTCSVENVGSVPSKQLRYDIDAYYDSAWHDLSYNFFDKTLFDMSIINYNTTVKFRCRINDTITTTAFVESDPVNRTHINTLMMYGTGEDEILSSRKPYSKGILADFSLEQNITIASSFADCNGDGYWDYYFEYDSTTKRIIEPFICINPSGIVKHTVGVFINKTGGNDKFCGDKTDGFCKLQRTYEVVLR